MNLILAHDSLTQLGGAERVVLEWMELFPSSPLYVLVADKKILDQLPEHIKYLSTPSRLPCLGAGGQANSPLDRGRKEMRIRTTPLQYLYNIYPHFQHLLPFIPLALWLTRIPECDVLLSSSSAFAKGFRARQPLPNPPLTRGGNRSLHINYCHTPTRFLWSDREYVEQEVPWIMRMPAKIFLWWMKGWDLRAAARVDKFLANSKEVQKRIKKYYNRDSEVVYPFVDVEKWRPPFPVIPCHDTGSLLESKSVGILAGVKIIKDSGSHSQTRLSGMTDKKDSYFLIAGRLHAHKHNDLVIEVCNELKINLHVVGQGRDEEHLRAIAGPTIKFLGRISDAELQKEYAEAMAYIYPQLEDFGLMPVEAAASGTPTIGANAGGNLETIVPGKTGEWFNFGDKESLRSVLQAWDKTRYTKEDLLRHAENFSKEKFDEKIIKAVKHE